MRLVQNICCWNTDTCNCPRSPLTSTQTIKLTYILFIILTFTLTTVLTITPPTATTTATTPCQQPSTPHYSQPTCIREWVTFRWFLALAVMHLLLVVAVGFRNSVSKVVNQGVWIGKGLVVGVVGVGLGYAGVGGMEGVRGVVVYLVPVWYLFQNLIIIDLIYTLESTLKQFSQSHPKLPILKAILSILLLLASVTINVLSYTHHRGPGQSVYISILNSAFMVIFLVVVLARVVKGHTMLVYGAVMVYMNLVGYWVRGHAVGEGEGQGEGERHGGSWGQYMQWGVVGVCMIGMVMQGSNKVRTKKSSLNEILSLNTSKQQQDNRYVSTNKWIIFHLIFLLTCLTLPWVLHQQAQSFPSTIPNPDPSTDPSIPTNPTANLFQTYRIINWFLILFVYLWTLVAARLYPERDFGMLFGYFLDQLENYFKEFQLN